ncbi:DUF1214 domain-containing protein [Sphingomonas montanisoli]|uniref:DUF1214 domain-containing protein n=1 Tax=Sphingomonas montanisoli TaxID=2606412 RepID=A0A5D9C7Y8_9SPHN|nr:DUF1214 domain-containing protein [Sphingomonas montanisoli]TZG27516.1 DUF1214 domain-containing protein [Sphingomonas montanisoli]
MTSPMDRWRDYDRTIISLGYDAARRERAEQNAADYTAKLRDGTAWRLFGEAIAKLGPMIAESGFAKDDRDLAEGHRYLMGLVAARIDAVLYACGPDRPAFVRGMDDIIKIGLDNPDGINSFSARIDGHRRYRISGRAGGERYVEFVQFGAKGTLANHYLHDFTIGADGRFELTLDTQSTPGNWLQLHPDTQGMFVRLIQYDWNTALTDLQIEHLGDGDTYECLAVPRPEWVGEELESLADTLVNEVAFWLDYTRSFAEAGDNRIAGEQPLAVSGKSAVRAAPKGMFALPPDEALLLEFDPPGGLFWSVALGDMWFRSIDPSHRQSSLNGHQAAIDPDGRYRFVIAHEDPGFANWLDTAGHARGCMTFRYVKTDSRPPATATVVKVADLDRLLSDAPRVTADERAATLAARARGFARRYAAPFTSRWNDL